MKKVVVKLDLHDVRDKQKALKTVSTIPGIDSLSMDMKEKKLTVIGDVDPVDIVKKLRKNWRTDIISVGPKEEPKKEEPKKEEAKKEEAKEEKKEEGKEEKKEEKKEEGKEEKKEEKKDEGKKEGEAKKEEETKKEVDPKKEEEALRRRHHEMLLMNEQITRQLVEAYKAYNPHMTSYYYVQSVEENPNGCIIC